MIIRDEYFKLGYYVKLMEQNTEDIESSKNFPQRVLLPQKESKL